MRTGKAQLHHHLPQSGWVSYPIRGDADVPGAIALFRLAYDRATAAQAHRSAGAASTAASPVQD